MEKREIKVTNLEQDIVSALKEEQENCIQLLNISENNSPKEIVDKIRLYVDDLLEQNHTEEQLTTYAITLGSMWGEMVVKEYGWQWKTLDFGDGNESYYVVSKNNFYCTPPLYFINKILMGENAGFDGNNDNTVLLLFNMLDNIEETAPSKNYQVIT